MTKKPQSITVLLAAPELFFEMNRKIWHKKLVRKSINKDDTESQGKTPITTDEIKKMLDPAKHPRDKAVIHFFASTGARPAGITDPVLRMKHLTWMPNPNNPTHELKWCYGIRIYHESKEGYWAFLTPEATITLDRYFGWRKNIRHEEFDDETPIFANFSKLAKIENLSVNGMRQIIGKYINLSGLKRTKKGHRYDKAENYMFRKRFNTILKLNNDVNSNIAEKLMAHKRGLDGTYLQPTKEECFREFVKAIPQLTIDPSERQKIEIELKQQKIDELESKTATIDDQTEELKSQDVRIKQLEKMYLQSKSIL
jgi:integrase/recombinase XerD